MHDKSMVMKLWHQVFVGLVLGVFAGMVLGEQAIYAKPLGDIFIRLIRMVISPLVFLSIVSGITQVRLQQSLGRLGLKASIAYLLTTLIAVGVGIALAVMLQPGGGLQWSFPQEVVGKPSIAPSPLEPFVSFFSMVVPENAIDALAKGRVLQIVFFAFFVGITVRSLETASAQFLTQLFKAFTEVVFKMVHYIVRLSPLAAFGFTAWVVGTQGFGVLLSLSKLIFCTYCAFLAQCVVYALMILVFVRRSPWLFFKKSLEYQAIAFASSSTKAALPTTMRVCQERLGISSVSASFVLPVGASINMNGIAIYLSVCALFFAQATGKVLTLSEYGVLVLTGTLGSIGGAGIPGGTLVMLPMVFSALGLPLEGIALVAGIDRIVDMMRSTVSITGDAAVALCIDASEGWLAKKTYDDAHL